jgi:hypothetical protein
MRSNQADKNDAGTEADEQLYQQRVFKHLKRLAKKWALI